MEVYRTCKHCEYEFDSNLSAHKRGTIDECGDCATDVLKSIGILEVYGKTDYCTTIISNPTSAQVKMVKAAGVEVP